MVGMADQPRPQTSLWIFRRTTARLGVSLLSHKLKEKGLMGRYEMRRQSQLIIPGLYLGPVQSALNSQKMKEIGITHVYAFPLYSGKVRVVVIDGTGSL